jgi:hypothetical protein
VVEARRSSDVVFAEMRPVEAAASAGIANARLNSPPWLATNVSMTLPL